MHLGRILSFATFFLVIIVERIWDQTLNFILTEQISVWQRKMKQFFVTWNDDRLVLLPQGGRDLLLFNLEKLLVFVESSKLRNLGLLLVQIGQILIRVSPLLN